MKLVNILFLSSVLLLSGCVESEFTLSEESRLPAWIPCASECSRDDLEVKFTFYTWDTVKIEVYSTAFGNNKLIQELTGVDSWHPKTIKDGILEKSVAYPHYKTIAVEGVIDVFETRAMEPVIYVSENPEKLN